MLTRRLVLVTMALACAVPASAVAEGNDPKPRIVNGSDASPGEYPAQGWLRVDTAGGNGFDFSCGGTLVGSRQFLTAAHCAVDNLGNPLPASGFNVRLGNVDKRVNTDEYTGVALAVHPDYGSDFYGNAHDVAMLTLNRPAGYEFMPVVESNSEGLWRPEVAGRLIASTIIGWGTTSSGASTTPNFLLENANVVPMRTDAACSSAYQNWQGFVGQNGFDSTTMVCAGDGNGDTCQGDSGGPLMVDDGGGGLVLVGVTSFGEGCNQPAFPGVYSRVGSEPLNSWVHERIPKASFSSSPAAPRAGEAVTFTSTSTAPVGFTTFNWDFDGDGQFDDAAGPSVSHVFGEGDHSVGLQSANALGDNAVSRRTIAVSPSAASSSAGGTGGSGGGLGSSAGGPGPDLTLPVVSSASLSTKVFAVNRSGPAERPVSSAKSGTTFRYRLSEPARVVFTIDRALPGRRAGGQCAKPTSRNRGKRTCTRYSRFGHFAHAGTAGSNSKRYSGRIGRKSMKPGRYRATLLARDPDGNRSKARSLELRVVRR